MKTRTLLLSLMLAFGMNSIAQEIRITDFQQCMECIMGRMEPVTDNNGNPCAVIRFYVNDNAFDIDRQYALKTDTLIGEIRMWVPTDTRHITIRHKGVHPLVRWGIPVRLQAKATYEATIDIAAAGNEERKQKTNPLYFDLGYSLLPLSGPSAALGLLYNHHNVEFDYTYGIGKTDDLFFYDNNKEVVAAYSYSMMNIQAKYGYEIPIAKWLSVIPQAGIRYNCGRGKEVSGIRNSNSKYHVAHSFSAVGALKVGLKINSHFWLYVIPEYSVSISKGQNCKWVSEFDSTFKGWCDGIGLNAGISIFF